MSQKKLINSVVIFLVIAFSACTSYKEVPYFQDLQRDKIVSEKIDNFTQLKMQPGDLLGIHVTSLNHEADNIFNYNLQQFSTTSLTGIDKEDQTSVVGYLVDPNGNINLPMVGNIKAEGLSTTELSLKLTDALSKFLTNPNINVRILNFKYSVLGDVSRPGSFGSKNEKVTVLDALATAGDANTTGIRTNVLLIREIGGKREYATLDLTSKNIFGSPYFYLKNNDVIYIQPNKNRVQQTDVGLQKASIIISAVSVVAILLNIIK